MAGSADRKVRRLGEGRRGSWDDIDVIHKNNQRRDYTAMCLRLTLTALTWLYWTP